MSKMLLQYHALFGLIISFLLYPVYGLSVLIIFFSNLLLDVDHYLLYVIKFSSFNIKQAHDYFIAKDETLLLPLHTVEFLMVLLLLSFYLDFVFFVLIGVVIHFMLDLRDELRFNYIGRFPSLIWYLIRKNLKIKDESLL